MFKVADMAPMQSVAISVEVRGAERPQPTKHRVDLCLLCDEGVLGCGAVAHLDASQTASAYENSFALKALLIQ